MDTTDLVVAHYDGILRFLQMAIEAVEGEDVVVVVVVVARRSAVKRALDIIIHLQARLRMDVGGQPAQVLSDFYASLFAQILQASQAASKPELEKAIECVKAIREAWARDIVGIKRINSPKTSQNSAHSGIL